MIADAQYADVAPLGSRHYRASLGKLRGAVEFFNGQRLAFVVHLGDLIDRAWASFDPVLDILSALEPATHHVLGNHDFEVEDSRIGEVPGRLGIPDRRRFVDIGEFRLILMDTTDVSTYAHAEGSPGRRAGEAELKRLQATRLVQAQSWNSGIGGEQMAWFEAACQEARREGRRVVVFGHHPLLPAGGHALWNGPVVLQALERQNNVVAWFNGHHHAGAMARFREVLLMTVPGMVETPDRTAFAVVHLFQDRLVISGHGRVPSLEWKYRS
jgi:predicted phosphodiesterase